MSSRLLMMVMLIEAIVVALSIAVVQMIDTSANLPSILIAVALLIVVSALLKFPWGKTLGWITQGYVMIVSFQNWALFILAVTFFGIWWWAYRIGKQIETQAHQRAIGSTHD